MFIRLLMLPRCILTMLFLKTSNIYVESYFGSIQISYDALKFYQDLVANGAIIEYIYLIYLVVPLACITH